MFTNDDPSRESRRLEALRATEVLDSEEDPGFDDLAQLAAHICQTPIALVSFVDADRQWFKAHLGLDVRETPRAHAFCAHSIRNPGAVTVVRDATADARFAANPLVLGDPHIRFYAGAPLITTDGHALGTLCVIDRTPREPSAAQIDALRALARQVMAQVKLRQTLLGLRQSKEMLALRAQSLSKEVASITRQNAELRQLSRTDGLTGIANRRAFDERLSAELSRLRPRNGPLSVIVVDIDRFKPFNDSFGHQAGDEALRQVAALLAEQARSLDLVARYGGEEFSAILPNTTAEQALAVAERMRSRIAQSLWRFRQITVSIGIATALESQHARALLERADQAMYEVKRLGGNRSTHADYFRH